MATPKQCGLCEHFRPYVDLKTKRIQKKEEGFCGWNPWFKLPMAYIRGGSGPNSNILTYISVRPVGVWNDTEATTCRCFEKLTTQ